MCGCAQEPEQDIRCHPLSYCLMALRKGLLLNWKHVSARLAAKQALGSSMMTIKVINLITGKDQFKYPLCYCLGS